jgi:hypothetical protein
MSTRCRASFALNCPSSLEDGQNLRHFVPDDGTQLIAGLVNFGPEFLADFGNLGLLLVGQV